MPFETSDKVNQHPDIIVYFEGLLLLEPGPNKSCNVFAIDHSSDHSFSFEVSLDQPQPNYPFLELEASDIIRSGLQIALKASKGVKKYVPSRSNAKEFSRSIDFHQEHSPSVKVKAPGTHIHAGVITLKDGVLFTARASIKPGRLFIEKGTKKGKCVDKKSVGLVLGASIELPKGQNLLLTWGTRAADKLELPREDEAEVPNPKYIILIRNSRKRPPEPGTKDFKHLYLGLDGVPSEDAYDFEFKTCAGKEPINPRTTPRIACMPGVVGG